MKTKILIIAVLAISLCACKGKNSKSQPDNVCEGNFPTETFQSILQQLDLKCDSCYLEFVSQQPLPDNPDLSVWIVPQITYMEKEGNDNFSFSLACHILLADNAGKIVSKHDEPYELFSDAYELKSLWVDTTFYRLSDKVSAFGISAGYAAGSSVSRASNTNTSLFIRQGDLLKKILDYESNNYHAALVSEDDGYVGINRQLTLSDKTTNGLYDIIVRKDSSFTVYAQNGDEEKATTETDFQFFRYNGKQYEERNTDNNSVICEKTYIEIGDYEECFYFGKTLAQVYEILKGKENHFKQYLAEVLPEEEAEYNFEENDETTHVTYRRKGNSLQILMGSVGGSTTIQITEKKKFTELTITITD